MVKSYLRGHEIECINDEWVYSDNKQPTVTTYKDRPCAKCGKKETREGHDNCLNTLIGVMNACCGHGIKKEAYIQFFDGKSIRGHDAIKIINLLKKYK